MRKHGKCEMAHIGDMDDTSNDFWYAPFMDSEHIWQEISSHKQNSQWEEVILACQVDGTKLQPWSYWKRWLCPKNTIHLKSFLKGWMAESGMKIWIMMLGNSDQEVFEKRSHNLCMTCFKIRIEKPQHWSCHNSWKAYNSIATPW